MIKNFLKQMVYKEANPYRLTLSFCLGSYIAFCPFIGLHTLMVLLLSPLLRLNMPVAMATSYAINNPLSMVPIYLLDYYVGDYIVYNILAYSSCMATPVWMQSIEQFMLSYLHISSPCIWSFLIGGNVVGVLSSIVLYPIVLYSVKKIVR